MNVNGPSVLVQINGEPVVDGDYRYLLYCLDYQTVSMQVTCAHGPCEQVSLRVEAAIDSDGPWVDVTRSVFVLGHPQYPMGMLGNMDIPVPECCSLLLQLNNLAVCKLMLTVFKRNADQTPNSLVVSTVMKGAPEPETGMAASYMFSVATQQRRTYLNGNLISEEVLVSPEPTADEPIPDSIVDTERFKRLT